MKELYFDLQDNIDDIIDNIVKPYEMIIDYFLKYGGCDTCKKCAYANATNNQYYTCCCWQYDQDGNTACLNGMLEYYITILKENQKKDKK